jgi:hypothetical protein
MSDFLPFAPVALPRLITTSFGPSVWWSVEKRQPADVVRRALGVPDRAQASRGVHSDVAVDPRRVGDAVAPVQDVDASARLDHHRRAVAAAGREARARVRHRAKGLAVVGRLLHHDVELTSREPAAPRRIAEERDGRAVGLVVPRHVDVPFRPDRYERVVLAPSAGVAVQTKASATAKSVVRRRISPPLFALSDSGTARS